ncbi:MAG: CdaR family protein [Butyribacter sp.]|nr:CdaR family protein [bacterium]MDY3854477.1 CdaR family protein [Butyribacter sp.]
MSQNQDKKLSQKLSAIWERIFQQNLSIKVLSFVGAIIVWLLITNINDPYKTKNFLVPVSTINEEALTSVNKVYEITGGSTTNVSVRGRRSVVDNLESSDIVAVADLSELSSVNAVPVKASLKKENISDVTVECSGVLKVSLEDMETKQVKVTVETEGVPAEGFSIGECIAKPSVIEVTGGESIVDRISTVRVTLNVNGASENFTKRLEPIAYDKRDKRVTSSTLTFSSRQVRVRAKVVQNKTIPVKLNITGEPKEGYEFIEATCLPQNIEVAGNQRILSDISELTVPVDISGLTSDSSKLEQEISVEDYLPKNTIVAQEYEKISVKIVIEKLQSKKIQLRVDNIKMKNLTDGYVAGIYNNTGLVDLTIQGRESVIKALPSMALAGYIDCKGLKEGEYMLPVKLDMEQTCSLVKEVKVKVIISKETDNSAATAAPSETPEEESSRTETDSTLDDEE